MNISCCGIARTIAVGIVLKGSLTGGVALAQDTDPDWPCVQRLVPVVSPAIMWPLPVEEGMHSLWQQDPDIRPLAERLGDLPVYDEAEQAAVRAFAESVPDEQKEERLGILAIGILDVTNGIRNQYIHGIKRYTRQQIAIAGQIEETLNRISAQEGSTEILDAEVNDPEQAELLTTLKWHERAYDQREHALRSLCEQPVELEEVLSDVLRDLAQYLP